MVLRVRGNGPINVNSTGNNISPWAAPINTIPKYIRKKKIWNICEIGKNRINN